MLKDIEVSHTTKINFIYNIIKDVVISNDVRLIEIKELAKPIFEMCEYFHNLPLFNANKCFLYVMRWPMDLDEFKQSLSAFTACLYRIILDYHDDIVMAVVNECIPNACNYRLPSQQKLFANGCYYEMNLLSELTHFLKSHQYDIDTIRCRREAMLAVLPRIGAPASQPQEPTLPDGLELILQRAVEAGLLDEHYQPIKAVPRTTIGMSKGQMKLFAQLAGKELNLSTPWKTFENLWSVKHLQSADIYDMSQERITVVKKLFGVAK